AEGVGVQGGPQAPSVWQVVAFLLGLQQGFEFVQTLATKGCVVSLLRQKPAIAQPVQHFTDVGPAIEEVLVEAPDPSISLVKEAEAQLLVENRNSEAHTLQNAHLHFLAPVEVALGLLQIGQVSGETHQASIGQRLFRYLHETALARENDMKARALGSSALLG